MDAPDAASSPLAPHPAASRPARMWLGLMLLAVVGVVGSSPFFAKVLPGMIGARAVAIPLTPVQLVAVQGLQSLVLSALAAVAGLWASRWTGLDAPLVRARLSGRPVGRRLLGLMPVALVAGTISSLAVVGLSLAAGSRIPAGGKLPPMSPWIAATGAFYGGIIEELLLRWGLLGLLAMLLVRVGLRNGLAFWIANIGAALIFGVGHLQAAKALGMTLTPFVISYLLVANGLVGVVCGWLFRKRGLESAMMAHGTADIWLHVAAPFFGA